MFDRILKRARDKIRSREYVVTYHARKEMNEDDLSIYDLERAILKGEIVERQLDKTTRGSKYRIRGQNIDGVMIEVVVKLGPEGTLVIITVYIL